MIRKQKKTFSILTTNCGYSNIYVILHEFSSTFITDVSIPKRYNSRLTSDMAKNSLFIIFYGVYSEEYFS